MLVLNMNSKRQRRPNVRLWEIGDVSAAFACGFSQKTRKNVGYNRYEHDVLCPNGTEPNSVCGCAEKIVSDFLVSDPGVSQEASADFQQNGENKNPKSSVELANSDEIDMTKSMVNFGTISKKSRVMRRRARSTKGRNSAFGSVWSSKLNPQSSNEMGIDCGIEEFVESDGYKGFSGPEMLATSKEGFYNVDDPTCEAINHQNCNVLLEQDNCYEVNNVSPMSGHIWDQRDFVCGNVNDVTIWLEDQGLGKYAGLFEMHEVDEEALPLLTLEDLKEMGVCAVGPRRKLYTAIQQLRKGGVSCPQHGWKYG